MAKIKALTLHQPWATLVAIGAKKIETRSWSTSYRGPLAIHASKYKDFMDRHTRNYICAQEPFNSILTKARTGWLFQAILPRGCIVATCQLFECHRIDRTPATGDVFASSWLITDQEKAFGDYTVGRYMWFLDNLRILPEPIPCAGSMGLWNIDEAMLHG